MTVFPHLAHPVWLLGLALLPILAWWRHRGAGIGALSFSRLPTPPRGTWRIHLPFYLRLVALGLVFVALARPQLGYAWEESLTEGIDIEIVLDISGSMAAEDFQPKNRLEVAKNVVNDFIQGRPADRLGLVVFSGTALTRAPLTGDREMLRFLIESVKLNSLPDGTAIGVALANAASRLKDSQAESKVVVLVTDGVNNAGAIDPMSAASICSGLGIRVYTIGVGTEGRVPVPMPFRNPLTGREEVRRALMDVEVDDELLQAIAVKTSGQFFKATDPEGLREVFDQIDRLETTPLQVKQYTRFEEAFQPWAQSALALLFLPLIIRATRLSIEP
ncbi:MAG: VWA domain-containing protein [Thermoanaerobaculia bacterium]